MVGFIFYPFTTKGASLSKDEFEIGESISIYGNGFGSRANSYSSVCFDNTSNCYNESAFDQSQYLNWTDTRIDIGIPGGISVDGEIIVYIEGQQEECYGDYCYTQSFSEVKTRLNYKIKPSINHSDLPSIAKPGDIITIPGKGFGANGRVYFDNYKADVVNWSDETVEVEITNDINEATKELKLYNKSGLYDSVNFTVFAGYSNDQYSYFQDYFEQIDLKKAWQEAEIGSEVTVAVIDDGVYVNHPDLRNNIWRNHDEIEGNQIDDDNNGYVDDVLGYNFVDENPYMETKSWHGTMVASIIGSEINNNKGIAGVAKNVKIMPIIVSNQEGTFVSSQKITEAIKYAVDNGADIINLSFGTQVTIGYSDRYNEAMEYAYDNDVVAVVAAGNGDLEGGVSRNLNSIPESPICNNNGKPIFLGVAALNNLDGENEGKKKTDWTNYGDKCVNISAPGASIVGATPPAHSEIGGFYYSDSGTSFSAPIVAGVAALLKSQNPDLKNWEIINRLIYTADDIDKYNPGYEGQLGGRVNAYQAFIVDNLSSELINISPNTIEAGGKTNLKVKGYLSDLSLKLVSQNYVMTFSSSQIQLRDPETLVLNIPRNATPGDYSFILKDGYDKIDELKNVLKITAPSEKDDEGEKEADKNTAEDSNDSQRTQTEKPSNNSRNDFLDREKSLTDNIDESLAKSLSGKILLQVEENGEGWYLNPEDNKKYYLGRPADSFNIMRDLGVGISEGNYNSFNKYAPERFAGKILLRVEANGEAYYVNPEDLKMYYLGKPKDAFEVMRNLGLGISNSNIRKINVGVLNNFSNK
jgi:subtilisin family serine protease